MCSRLLFQCSWRLSLCPLLRCILSFSIPDNILCRGSLPLWPGVQEHWSLQQRIWVWSQNQWWLKLIRKSLSDQWRSLQVREGVTFGGTLSDSQGSQIAFSLLSVDCEHESESDAERSDIDVVVRDCSWSKVRRGHSDFWIVWVHKLPKINGDLWSGWSYSEFSVDVLIDGSDLRCIKWKDSPVCYPWTRSHCVGNAEPCNQLACWTGGASVDIATLGAAWHALHTSRGGARCWIYVVSLELSNDRMRCSNFTHSLTCRYGNRCRSGCSLWVDNLSGCWCPPEVQVELC